MTINDIVGAIRDLSKGVLKVNAADLDRASNHHVGFNGTFTTTGSLTIWTPSLGTHYKVKGLYVVGAVDTLLAASNAVTFFVADGTSGGVLAPIASAAATAAAGTLLPSTGAPVYIDLREGVPGSAATTTLVIKASATIGTGVVRFTGCVVGEEVVD